MRPDKDSLPRYPEESRSPQAPFFLHRQTRRRGRVAQERASKHFDYRIRHSVDLFGCHFRIERQRQYFMSRAFGDGQLSGLATQRSIGRLKM